MIKKISKTEEIRFQLQKEGKINVLNQAVHFAAIEAMNKQMLDVRREYEFKDKTSQTAASEVVLKD